ncbi:MAG: glycoside hydrolase family 10 protein [Longimicrobiales bacterium]
MRSALGPNLALALSLLAAGCTLVGPQGPTPTTTQPEAAPSPPLPNEASGRPAAVGPTVNPVRSFDEVRAVWVVRYTMTSAEAVTEMVENAEAAGINTLLVQVRGRADAFYSSDLEPRGESVREPDFDPLELAIELAHNRGMAVHAWVNTHLVWGPAELPESPKHLVNAHPDWLAVPRDLGEQLLPMDPFDDRFVAALVQYARDNPGTVEGVYSSPSHPEVQDRVRAVWLDLAAGYDLDGIHYDYIRFPSGQYDYSMGALERFRLWARTPLTPARFEQLDDAYLSDLYAFVEGEPTLWADFRREQVTRLVRRIHHDVKEINPRLVISAAVIADTDLARNDRFQEWPVWLRDGLIDIAVPMAYTPDSSRFASLIQVAADAAENGDRLWAGIGAYMNSVDGTLGMIDIARQSGAGGVVLFSYDWAVGEGIGDPSNPYLQRIGQGRFGR